MDTRMKALASLAVMASCIVGPVHADGYIMGAGRWTCDDVGRIAKEGTPSEIGQLAGWIMGFWTAATFQRETAFVDKVEAANGIGVVNATIGGCADAPGDTALYKVAERMIENTR